MPDGYRNGAFALGLVTGIGLAANLVVWSAYFAKNNPESQPGNDKQQEHGESPPVEDFWSWFYATFIDPNDSIAQWVITFATIFAAYLLLRTLWATQNMARDTREIGEAQVRAYIKCSKVTCKPLGNNGQDDLFSLHVELQNFGQSPATVAQLLIGIELMRFDGTRAGSPIQINAPTDPAMAPQGATTAMLSFGYAIGAADEIRESKAYLRFTVALVFDDVFGKRSEFITYHHTEGSLLDSGITASHIVGVKPEYKPK